MYSLVEQYKTNSSLARRAITELTKRGLITPVVTHSRMLIYTKA